MRFENTKILISPLIKGAHEWQYVSINGVYKKPKFFFSDIQWVILLVAITLLFKLKTGISKEIVGYIMGAFSISVSLFMSLLVSIFDKFEKTNFNTIEKSEEEIKRLIQKKNFFKRFISITSYLVILSIIIIILCSITFIFPSINNLISLRQLSFKLSEIDFFFTIKNAAILTYRVILVYFLLNYLFLTFFIAGSAHEYYMSEMNKEKISLEQ